MIDINTRTEEYTEKLNHLNDICNATFEAVHDAINKLEEKIENVNNKLNRMFKKNMEPSNSKGDADKMLLQKNNVIKNIENIEPKESKEPEEQQKINNLESQNKQKSAQNIINLFDKLLSLTDIVKNDVNNRSHYNSITSATADVDSATKKEITTERL